MKKMAHFENNFRAVLTAMAMFSCEALIAADPAPENAFRSLTLAGNARIYAFDEAFTRVERGALVFSEQGEIVAVGADEALRQRYPGAEQVDLEGKTVLPGLIDSHGHLYGLALTFTQANLVGTKSKTEVLQRLREFESGLPDGAWLLGRGWDQNDWAGQAFPNRGDLDAAFPDRPVWLRRIDGHAAWANSVALAQADRDLSGDWQPRGGSIHRDSEGQPTGIFVDRAMQEIGRLVPAVPDELISTALDIALHKLVSLGLTGVHDPGIDLAVVGLYRQKIEEGAFPLRVYAMADGMNQTLEWLCRNGPLNHASGRLIMRSVKLYADGALGSRGAALLADYSDEAGNNGLLFENQQTVEANIGRVVSCGLQAGVHAIGDRANRQVLNAYAAVLPQFPDNPGRHRVEHAQILDPADIPRFSALDVIAAMQPTHATSDMYWADERLGSARLSGAYAWKSLRDSGARLAFGSDFPVEQVNPMHGIHTAVTRQDLAGEPEGGWQAQERLTRMQAIRGFTLDAAYAGFMENEVGSLEAGKKADFIVLERDIMTIPADQIPQLRVIQTWVNGKRVY